MERRALITGGAGFVGRHLVNRLLNDNWEVVVLDNFVTGSRDSMDGRAEIIEGDIRDQSTLAIAAKHCDLIFHLAAQVELQKSIIDPADCFSTNVTGTANIVMEALRVPGRRLVFASSCAVYPLDVRATLSEEMEVSGGTPYAMSKVWGEKIMAFYREQGGLNYSALRCFNIYGTGQKADGLYSAVIPKFMTEAKSGGMLELNGGGSQTRDFIHVDDVVEAYLLFAQNQFVGVVNVGTGVATSILSLARIVCGFENLATMKSMPACFGDAASSCADLSRLQAVSNFRTKVSIRDGLERVYFS